VRAPDEFSAAVLHRLQTGLPAEQALARRRLSEESWEVKAAQLEQSLLAARAGERSPAVPPART
jgi:hypothetical protein